MNTQQLSSQLETTRQKLAKFRKTHPDKTQQRKLADQTINLLCREIKPAYLSNAFINNNLQSKSDAVKILQHQTNQLKQSNNYHPNKKTAHDFKKAKSDLVHVNNLHNQWINFTGNGKTKPLNLKTLINAIQELEEYL